MKFLTVFTPLVFALPAVSLFILLPLYVYPGTDASAWSNVTAAIAAYPHVQWQIIINVNSGPGPSEYPDSNFITGISRLNSHPNVLTLGYVDTAYAKRNYTSVTSDIDIYANWAYYTQTKDNISMAGIFFDDVVDNTTFTTAAQDYYRDISRYAYGQVPSDVTPVVFNPGELGPSQLFQYCNTMIQFEGSTQTYNNDTTIKSLPSAYLGQSAIIVYDATAITDVKSLVHTMARDGIEAVYFDYGYCTYKGSITGCYNQTGLVDLKQLVEAVQAG
jgi:hypothetical protein